MTQIPLNIDIIVFAKAAIPGRVKTRLTPALSPDQAAWAHAAMVEAVVARVARLAAKRWLAATPDDAQFDAAGFSRIGQGTGDLGARLRRVTAAVWSAATDADPPRGLIVIGTDSPDLPIDRFVAAAAAVGAGRAAAVPAFDGGYCLIAAPRPAPALFAGIEWGTARVMAQTRAAAIAAGIALTELAPWHDVDTLDDLCALRRRIVDTEDAALRRLRERLDSAKLPLSE